MALGVDQAQITDMIAEMQQLQATDPDAFAQLVKELESQANELDDGQLVAYADECVRESYEASRTRRERWDRLWDAHENEMPEYRDKEDWQNAIVLNKPFTTTVQAKTLVRRGFMERPDYFSLDPTDKQDEQKVLKGKFWTKALTYWCGTQEAHLPTVFSDATDMGFAMGVSMGTKIKWRQDDNGIWRLMLDNIDPRKLFDDPDGRKPRKPQSGLYMVHEEWVDLHDLYADAERRLYDMQRVKLVRTGRDYKDAAGYSMEDKEDERQRKGLDAHRNRYRKAVNVREVWGSILDENGELVMANTRFTVANGIVIRKPKKVPFPRLRWPIMQHSPLPHVLRFSGYGLWEGVMAMWKFQNNVLNLFGDNENWRIHNMYEIDPSRLEDPNDREVYPGKMWPRKKNAQDGPAITPVLKGDNNIQDVQFIWELATRSWDEGSFVTEPLKGAQQEQDRTLGELQMKFSQSMGVFDSIGKDVEQGAVQVLWAIKEVLTTFWDMQDSPSLIDVFGRNSEELQMMEAYGLLLPEARMKEMSLDTDIKVQGISRLLDRADLIERLQFLITIGDNPRFAPYMKDFDICKRLFSEFNQDDLILTEDELKMQQRTATVDTLVQSALAGAGVGNPPAGAAGTPAPPGAAGAGALQAPPKATMPSRGPRSAA